MTTSPPPVASRWPLVVATVVYLVLLAVLLLDPTGTTSSNGTELLIRTARRLHGSDWVVAHVEFLANVAIWAPVPILGTAFLGRRPVATWIGWVFVVALAVETLQAVALSNARVASTADVVANTLGGALGAVLAAAYCSRRR